MDLDASTLISQLSGEYQDRYRQQNIILTFNSFLELLQKNPRTLTRNAAEYICDTFDFFGKRTLTGADILGTSVRFKLFDQGTEKNIPIVGGENVQSDIHSILKTFVRQGYVNKLILMHGPNGSSKSSTVESISYAMQKYSELEAGAVYRFNWIFPTEKYQTGTFKGDTTPIGFASTVSERQSGESYALLDDTMISSKIHSEFKDNPIYLIPMPQREIWLRNWIGAAEGKKPEDVELPPHVLHAGLSKRNQLIFENMLAAYEGDLAKVLRHIQVERFYYNRQYRVGISTVEPQMAIDAHEKQLTMDRNISNLPAVLHNIRFYEAQGELIEANRGILEFSDLLKRPLESFKYLLTSVERSSISLPSSTANLDIVFLASSNEKHLDTFKTIPDFSSFRGRFELVTVPYLLRPGMEVKIYEKDIAVLAKTKKISPYALKLLCVWAVMTRYKQPDPEYYESTVRGLIARLDPRSKSRLYDGEPLHPVYKHHEESQLKDLRLKILNESIGMVIYEGRFGASPREIKQILHRAAQNPKHKTLTPMSIFEELERISKDRTVYEFLQFEPRGKYHDSSLFITMIRDEFADIFEDECMRAMSMVKDEEYDRLLIRYVENAVADVKKEKIYSNATEQYEPANQGMMKDIEKILGVQGSVERHREGLLSRIAGYKLDNPTAQMDIPVIFSDYLSRIQEHYYDESKVVIQEMYQAMLVLDSDEERTATPKLVEQARHTFAELDRRFGYDAISARESLMFMLAHNKKRTRTK